LASHETSPGRVPGAHMGLDEWRTDICNAFPSLCTIADANGTQSIQRDGCNGFSYLAKNRLLCLKRSASTFSLQLVDINARGDGQPLGLDGRVLCAFQLGPEHRDVFLDIAGYPSHRPGATFQLRPENRIISITCHTAGPWHTSTATLRPYVVPVTVLLWLAEGRKGESWSWNEWRWFTWNSNFSSEFHGAPMTSSRMATWKERSRFYPQPIPIHFFEHPPGKVGPRAGDSVYAIPLVRREKFANVVFQEGTKLMRVMISEDNLVVWEVRLILLALPSSDDHDSVVTCYTATKRWEGDVDDFVFLNVMYQREPLAV